METSTRVYFQKQFELLLKATLNSFSQVIFIENWLSGLLIIVALLLSSVEIAIMAFLSALIVNSFTLFLLQDTSNTCKGLNGFNAVLTGIASYFFFDGASRWVVFGIFAIFSILFSKGLHFFFEKIGLSAFTLPFILVTWVGILSSYFFSAIHVKESTASFFSWEDIIQEQTLDWSGMLFKGFGEIFLLDHIGASLCILLAILIASKRMFFLSFLAIAMTIGITFLFSGDRASINMGIPTYNVLLTLFALDFSFNTLPKRQLGIWLLLGAISTVFIHFALTSFLSVWNLSVLTLPFVLATWLITSTINQVHKQENC